ncbi:MAG: thiamine pyrophosphate-binding protein, partial [Syntrophomonas sp.]|nr:thiamine pyrophosphate-binding protein [Syntrophomonas sp.]
MIGAEIIKEVIIKNNLRRVFVYPGGTIAPILDELYKENIEIFCTRHEQGAGYAALAAARITGQTQVVLVTSGPGVTNVVTTIADAYFDSVPLVLITGQVATSDLSNSAMSIRQRGFQEVNTISILESITKAQFLVKDVLNLEKVLEDAFSISKEGRPGPVVIDMPMDIQRSEINNVMITSKLGEEHNKKEAVSVFGIEECKHIANKISSASRPIIIAGQGILGAKAYKEFQEFVDMTNIPVSHSLLGLGAYPTNSDISIGFHGHTGNRYANKAIYEADLVLVFGSRLDIRQTGSCYDQFSPHAYVVRIDIDENEIVNSRIKNDLSIVANIRVALSQLNQYIANLTLPDWKDWRDCIK